MGSNPASPTFAPSPVVPGGGAKSVLVLWDLGGVAPVGQGRLPLARLLLRHRLFPVGEQSLF